MATENKLPTLSELSGNIELALRNDKFKILMNQDPPKGFLKPHPSAKKKIKKADGTVTTVAAEYLPINIVEFFLDSIFQEWKIEVLREGVMFNSIYVTVRVHFKNPITGEWSFHDGVGGKGLQLDADSKASDMSRIKAEAVMMALPSAKSYAIKDACEHIGKLFGRDVNRTGTPEFTGNYHEPEKRPDREDKSEERILAMINAAKTEVELSKLKDKLTNPKTIIAYDERAKQIRIS